MKKKDEEVWGKICCSLLVIIGITIYYWYISIPIIIAIIGVIIYAYGYKQHKKVVKTKFSPAPVKHEYVISPQIKREEQISRCPNCETEIVGNYCDLCGWEMKICKWEALGKCGTRKNIKDCYTNCTMYTYETQHEQEEKRSRVIPKAVQREVWRRDMGRCVECGSKEYLEYDHIIPFSKGGSNTVRNIQLLCESCNRKKFNKI